MKVEKTILDGVLIIEPDVFADDRGYFFESFSLKKYQEAGIPAEQFVQDNASKSRKGVVRGLHYQAPPFAQGKLVQVLRGRVLDVALDIRSGSPTYGQHVMVELSEENHRQLWLPAGFAHAFMTLEDDTIFTYKTTNPYNKESDRGIRFDDPALGIAWPAADVIVSEKDAALPLLADIVQEFVFEN